MLQHVRARIDLETWLVSRRRGDEHLVLASGPDGAVLPVDPLAW